MNDEETTSGSYDDRLADPQQSGPSSIQQTPEVPDFYPDDPTDSRKPGDWKTRYDDEESQKAIRFERNYLFSLLFLIPFFIVVLQVPQALPTSRTWLQKEGIPYDEFLRFAYAWLGGSLGGTLFDIKWLYHTVAKNLWNLDRRLWRLFVPHVSGVLGFSLVLLMSSNLIRIFDQETLKSLRVTLAIGFVTGLFSDTAMAKLKEVAETLFGTSKESSVRSDATAPSPGRSSGRVVRPETAPRDE